MAPRPSRTAGGRQPGSSGTAGTHGRGFPAALEPGQLWGGGGGSQKFTRWEATSRCRQQHSAARIAELLLILHLGEAESSVVPSLRKTHQW
ncbi:hypothetical protein DV515_00013116 [Chloebia gouldiae]|uniref:Uncharacterized protein n=1 Tax=Chloebia gouldiae TaxID=44316 RepID=A0A3L8S2X8_CHLGU|nr:hypothetical protein DV515_00013116 [Chloebia gouldiae]